MLKNGMKSTQGAQLFIFMMINLCPDVGFHLAGAFIIEYFLKGIFSSEFKVKFTNTLRRHFLQGNPDKCKPTVYF